MSEKLPEWGTQEALMMGVAHPDWPWHTPESRAKYEWPNGWWWRDRCGGSVSANVEYSPPIVKVGLEHTVPIAGA